MKLHFTKYQGTGNDFVMVDGRDGRCSLSVSDVRQICDRHFGVGADGLIIIESHASLDFTMNYYNSDGSQSFCGNGSRCAVHFIHQLGMLKKHYRFEAIDGEHEAYMNLEANHVEVKMRATDLPERHGNDYFTHTGSPHYIRYVADLDEYNVLGEGQAVRFSTPWKKAGTNVNFVEQQGPDVLKVRTYERGVEAETLSCGTGVTAVAITDAWLHGGEHKTIITPGGSLEVRFKRTRDQHGFEEIWLCGPATSVFTGSIELTHDSYS